MTIVNTYSSALENMTSLDVTLVNMNNVMGNIIGVGFLISLTAIVFLMLFRNNGSVRQSLAGGSVFGLLLSYLFWGLGIVGITYVFIFFILTVGSVIWLNYSPD
jgi:hypothetical protein